MHDWSIEIFKSQFAAKILAEKFSNVFPQRTNAYFERIIESIDGENSKIYLLIIKDEVKGAFFSFRVFGYDFEVWSPSYLYVEKECRNLSLLFMLGAFKKMSKNIINVSPTDDVRKILSAVRYKEISKGSLMIPAFLGVIKPMGKQELIKCLSPILRFSRRDDLIWFCSKNRNIFFCVKKTSRYSIPFFILVYFFKDHLDNYISDLLAQIAKINPLGVLIVPDFGGNAGFISLRSSKFHSLSNITELGNTYSILGSEVTEVI